MPTIVHCHTWYSHFGGILAKLNYGLPLVITVHSLEPLRPWKREQLAGGYDFTRLAGTHRAGNGRRRYRCFGRDKEGHRAAFQRQARAGCTSSTTGSISMNIIRSIQRPHSLGTNRSGEAVSALRRTDHPAEGNRSSRARDSIHGSGISNRALRGRAGHAGDRGGNESRGRPRRQRNVRM